MYADFVAALIVSKYELLVSAAGSWSVSKLANFRRHSV